MREIGASQAAAGLEPSLFEAMAEVYAGIAATALGRAAPEDAGDDLAEALRGLRQDSAS
jgi:hypothetical protein